MRCVRAIAWTSFLKHGHKTSMHETLAQSARALSVRSLTESLSKMMIVSAAVTAQEQAQRDNSQQLRLLLLAVMLAHVRAVTDN